MSRKKLWLVFDVVKGACRLKHWHLIFSFYLAPFSTTTVIATELVTLQGPSPYLEQTYQFGSSKALEKEHRKRLIMETVFTTMTNFAIPLHISPPLDHQFVIKFHLEKLWNQVLNSLFTSAGIGDEKKSFLILRPALSQGNQLNKDEKRRTKFLWILITFLPSKWDKKSIKETQKLLRRSCICGFPLKNK